jgi:hypothetical protein
MMNSGNQFQRDAVSHSKAIDVLCVVIPVARGHATGQVAYALEKLTPFRTSRSMFGV